MHRCRALLRFKIRRLIYMFQTVPTCVQQATVLLVLKLSQSECKHEPGLYCGNYSRSCLCCQRIKPSVFKPSRNPLTSCTRVCMQPQQRDYGWCGNSGFARLATAPSRRLAVWEGGVVGCWEDCGTGRWVPRPMP